MKILTLLILVFLTWFGLSAPAGAADNPWAVDVGYRYLTGVDFEYSHDSHPDDRWLPNGSVPGSAGKTYVSDVHAIQLGLSRDFRLGEDWVAWSSLQIGFGLNTDNHQNDNDYRPPENGAFVFSWPLLITDVGVGVGYEIGRVRLGAEVRGGGLLILSGYDRYSSLDVQSTDWEWLFGAGPKVSVRLWDHVAIEGGVLFGNVTSASVSLAWKF